MSADAGTLFDNTAVLGDMDELANQSSYIQKEHKIYNKHTGSEVAVTTTLQHDGFTSPFPQPSPLSIISCSVIKKIL